MDNMEYLRFKDLYEISSRNGLSRPSAVRGEGYKMVNMGELFSNDIITDIPMERVNMSDRELRDFLLKEDDLLFARQSLVESGAGKCSIVRGLKEPTTFESHLIRVRLKKEMVNPWYYYYLFQLPYNPIKTIVNRCAQSGVRGSELAKLKVPFPSRQIQDYIVNILKPYDDLIENNNKRIVVLESILENLYSEWFIRWRFPGYEDMSMEEGHPCGWKYVTLGDLVSFERGISYSSEEINVTEGVNLINLKNLQSYGGFRKDGTKLYNGKYKENQVVNKGDLILGVTDMTQERRTVGAVAIIPEMSTTCVISADLVKMVSDLPNEFLYCLCKYGHYSTYFSQFANGTNVLHLKPATLLNIKLLLPSLELINLFTEQAKSIFEMIEKLNLLNDNLKRQRDMFLPRLMNGKLGSEQR